MKISIFPEYYKTGIAKSFSLYWQVYGGWKELRRSPYVHLSILITALLWPIWVDGNIKWYEFAIEIIPNILGFTLGGYAILLAFGNEKFMFLISGEFPDNKPSPFLIVNGAFVHFIVIQGATILFAIIGKVWKFDKGYLAVLGCIFFAYTILSAIAAAMAILNLADWFNKFSDSEQKKKKNKTSNC